jgi:hypothetical protein
MKKSGKILKVGCSKVRRGRDTPIRGDTPRGGGYKGVFIHTPPPIMLINYKTPCIWLGGGFK